MGPEAEPEAEPEADADAYYGYYGYGGHGYALPGHSYAHFGYGYPRAYHHYGKRSAEPESHGYYGYYGHPFYYHPYAHPAAKLAAIDGDAYTAEWPGATVSVDHIVKRSADAEPHYYGYYGHPYGYHGYGYHGLGASSYVGRTDEAFCRCCCCPSEVLVLSSSAILVTAVSCRSAGSIL